MPENYAYIDIERVIHRFELPTAIEPLQQDFLGVAHDTLELKTTTIEHHVNLVHGISSQPTKSGLMVPTDFTLFEGWKGYLLALTYSGTITDPYTRVSPSRIEFSGKFCPLALFDYWDDGAAEARDLRENAYRGVCVLAKQKFGRAWEINTQYSDPHGWLEVENILVLPVECLLRQVF